MEYQVIHIQNVSSRAKVRVINKRTTFSFMLSLSLAEGRCSLGRERKRQNKIKMNSIYHTKGPVADPWSDSKQCFKIIHWVKVETY
jgi:hypothetical protein